MLTLWELIINYSLVNRPGFRYLGGLDLLANSPFPNSLSSCLKLLKDSTIPLQICWARLGIHFIKIHVPFHLRKFPLSDKSILAIIKLVGHNKRNN